MHWICSPLPDALVHSRGQVLTTSWPAEISILETPPLGVGLPNFPGKNQPVQLRLHLPQNTSSEAEVDFPSLPHAELKESGWLPGRTFSSNRPERPQQVGNDRAFPGKKTTFLLLLFKLSVINRVCLVGIQVQALVLLLLSSVSLASSLHWASAADRRHCLSLGVPGLAGTLRTELWSMAVSRRGWNWLDSRGMAYLFMCSMGRIYRDTENWHRLNLSPCRPLVGVFCRTNMPQCGLLSEWINDGCNFDWNLLAIIWTLGVKHTEVCL